MKLNIKIKTYSRKKTNNKMMNQFCILNIMKIKMISITTTLKWPMIFHPKKEATLKMKKENLMMGQTTMKMKIDLEMKPTLKIKMKTIIPKATSTTNKVFTTKSEKVAAVKKTEKTNRS